jgi:hypothetical protein
MEIGDDVTAVTEAEWNQIRALTDQFQAIAETVRLSRYQVAAAVGVLMGEQYPTEAGLKDAISQATWWAMLAHSQGVQNEG